ncbi:MAG TPA: response regulator transcription factor [Actinocrinis sp.]|nr:response regulator transcription factor [Actinocrinis sp.]
MENHKITVVLVDDHVLVREGVREIISVEKDIVVVSEAANSEDAIAKVVHHRPDVVLLDVEIPGRHAADTVARMRALSPQTRVIVLSMYDGPQLLRQLIAGGIRGYLLKSVDRQELVSAIRSVYSTDRMVLAISRESMAQMHSSPETVLSRREREILELVAQALSNGQIASRLGINEATVKRHLHSVFAKLDAVSRIDAVNKAMAASMITAREGSNGHGHKPTRRV